MKPVVLIMAAAVLLLICLANHRQECKALKTCTDSIRTAAICPAGNKYHYSKVENADNYMKPVSFSGKQFNFFLITF